MRKLAAGVLLIGLAGHPAQAQNVQTGKAIAQMWCANCHVVDKSQHPSGNDAVPSFPAIARMSSTTAASLAAFLTTPHPRMPNYELSRQEIRDVSAYILSLQD
jgi:mono/diheme cytochrome c family protein